ncbi:TRAP transporter substrate-binding protein DctP [Castellaniella sp. GW247-6E4]|uniref:TRAP transporter substrate-binding protein n=1 Tax=Castellaniella sp. GW247-6E4 TaxID=3140380 RepID=UPI0033154C98
MIKAGEFFSFGLRRAAIAAGTTLSLALFGMGVPAAQAQSATVLKTAFYQPDGHPIIELSKEVFSKIERETEGRVKFRVYAASTLVPTTEMASGVNDGTAFMAIWYMPYMSKTIPLFDIETIPVWTGGCKGVVGAFDAGLNDIYTEALVRQGLTNVKVAGVSECLPRVLAVSQQVRRPADSKGLKIRSVGAESDMIRDIGASPVNMTMDQVYEAMSRGIINGVTNAFMMIEDRSQFELVKHVTNMDLTSVLMHVIYNPSVLDKLDPRDRKTVESGMREVADHVRVGLSALNEKSIARASESLGVQVYQPNAEEHKEWVQAAQASRKVFEDKAAKDPLIQKGLEYVYQFNPQN